MPTKKNDDSTENEVLNFLVSNFDKLKILLSPSLSKKPFKYRFKGKKGTKTVFMSIKLQYLINEYCIENDTKIGDITETAIVEFLLRHDYTGIRFTSISKVTPPTLVHARPRTMPTSFFLFFRVF